MVTSNLGIIEPTEAQQQKTITIGNAYEQIDQATQGATALTITGAKVVTATEFNNGFSLELTGTPSAGFTLTVPANKRFFRVENGTDGAATVTTGSGTTVVVAVGMVRILYCDGTNITEEGGGSSGSSLFNMIVAISDEVTTITTGTAKVTFRMPAAVTLTAGNGGIRISLNTVSSSGLVTVDVNEEGVTILSTKVTIDVSEKTSLTAAAPVVISDVSLADDAEITVDIDVAGTGAKGLKLTLIGTYT